MGEKKPPLESTTLRGPPPQAPSGGRDRFPCLTVLCHPDSSRVGEHAFLDGKTWRLSRIEPDFSAGAPLTDPHLSRTALRMISLRDGGVRIEPEKDATAVVVDGEAVNAPRELGAEALERGLVLELASRVALLLHLRAVPRSSSRASSLLGGSEAIERLREEIERVGDLDLPVLVRGSTGSGKELVARELHLASPRKKEPFVAVNVAAVPATMAASQLFGHTRGAFTGADKPHRGFFSQAAGGTLFLDEIGDTPLDVQAMLLRAIEDKSIQPLGSHAPEKADVRVIAATDADLEVAVSEGRFRAPLLHRLAGYRIAVPPLRQRREDIARLLIGFLREELAAASEPDRLRQTATEDPLWLSTSLMSALVRHDWPGNVRELRNVARHLVVSNRGAKVAGAHGFLADLVRSPSPSASAKSGPDDSPPGEIDDARLVESLRAHGWKTGAAAKALGISKTTLYALIDRSPSIRKAKDLSKEEIESSSREHGGDLDRMSEGLRVSRRGLQLRMKELRISP